MDSGKSKKSPFSFGVVFPDERFERCGFESSHLDSFFKLIEDASSEASELFFEIERKDSDLLLQVFCQNDSFCIFQDSYEHKIYILGPRIRDDVKPEFIQVVDDRWPLTYFLPLESFVVWVVFKEVVSDTLISGRLENYFEFSQTFPDLGLPSGYC